MQWEIAYVSAYSSPGGRQNERQALTDAVNELGKQGWEPFAYVSYQGGTIWLKRPLPAVKVVEVPETLRGRAVALTNIILKNFGSLSAVIPSGPLRNRVDTETEHVAALAEAIYRDFRPNGSPKPEGQ